MLVSQDINTAGAYAGRMSGERLFTDRDFDKRFSFVSFGVTVDVESNSELMLAKAREVVGYAFGEKAEIFEGSENRSRHVFGIGIDGEFLSLFKDGTFVSKGTSERNFFKFLNSVLRLEVGEFAYERVFLHAGVVGWKGQAIIFPAKSFSGKSTLTAELVKNGAEYYSDEYAVLKSDGLVETFPKAISMRYFGGTRERDVPVEEFGGRVARESIPVGMVLFTSFSKEAVWNPELLSSGNAIMEILPHALTIRQDPAFSLKVLDLVAQRAIMVKSPRGDVKKFAKFLLAFFDNHITLAKMA